jgi:4-hydroxy-3-polyprenylbenzoate decarboxylase
VKKTFDDLRDFLKCLEAAGELITIKEEVDWNLEACAIMRRCNEIRGPVPLFENIRDYPGYRMTSADIQATFGRYALAMGLEPSTPYREIVAEYDCRTKKPLKPTIVRTGPCKENIHIGADADFLKLPAPMIHSGDGGRYLGTSQVGVTNDFDSNWINWGTYRFMVHDSKTAGIFFQPTKHATSMYRKYEAANRPMEFASFVGGDPLVYVAAAGSAPYGVSEAEVVGGLRGRPIELVRCETVDLMVPATSEIVIEGEILPHERRNEGPFGEYTGYQMQDVFPRPLFKIKAITHRHNPILTVEVEGTPVVMGHINGSIVHAAEIKKALLRNGLPVTGVYVPPESANHMVIVAAERTPYPIAFRIASGVWASAGGRTIPHVIVVDSDVDPADMGQVIHAMATKCHPGRGITIIPNTPTSQLTPFLSTQERKAFKGAFAVYDCTWPTDWETSSIPVKVSFDSIYPKEIQEKVVQKWTQYGFKR